MSAAAVEALLELQRGLRIVRPTDEQVERWELQSELALVCPEVRRRALELLPERDPNAFLARPRLPIPFPPVRADERLQAPGRAAAVAGYTLSRLVETARTGLVFTGALVALTLLAEMVH